MITKPWSVSSGRKWVLGVSKDDRTNKALGVDWVESVQPEKERQTREQMSTTAWALFRKRPVGRTL